MAQGRRALAATLLAGSLAAGASFPAAQPAEPPETDGGETSPRERLSDDEHWFNLRVGASSADQNGRPAYCLEVSVIAALSVEGCGTGTGVLHGEGGELAHFRAKWSLIEGATAAGKLRAQLGAGFAELQLGDDEPGFDFGDPPEGLDSAAGPEGALSLQLLTHFGRGFELVTSATAGVAHIRGADQFSVPQDPTQLFVSFEVGLGF